ncbi:hypothetical protein HY994_05030 [Candidatus Micrarchaeota archaeon]|nr:hypothetical protein [Candidatus Micrarchaeota archaeon]
MTNGTSEDTGKNKTRLTSGRAPFTSAEITPKHATICVALALLVLFILPIGAVGPNTADVSAGGIFHIDVTIDQEADSWMAFYGLANPTGTETQTSIISGPNIQSTTKAVQPRVYMITARYAPPCLTKSDWLFITESDTVRWDALVPADLARLNDAAKVEPGTIEDAGRFFIPNGSVSIASIFYPKIPRIELRTQPGKPPFVEYALWDYINRKTVFAVPLVYPSVPGFDGSPVNFEAFLPRGPTYRFLSHPGLCLPKEPVFIGGGGSSAPATSAPVNQPVIPPSTIKKPAPSNAPLPDASAKPDKPTLPKKPDETKKPPIPIADVPPIDKKPPINPETGLPITDAPIKPGLTPPKNAADVVADAKSADEQANAPLPGADSQDAETVAPIPPSLVPPLVVTAVEAEPVIAAGQTVQVSGTQSGQSAVSAEVTTHQTILDTVVTFETAGEHTLVVDYPFPAEYFEQGIVSLNLEVAQDSGNTVKAAPQNRLDFDSEPKSKYRLERIGNATRVVWLVNAEIGEVFKARATVRKALTPERIKMTAVHQFKGDQTKKIFPTPLPPPRLKVQAQALPSDGLLIPLVVLAAFLFAASWLVWKRPWMVHYLTPDRWQYLYYYATHKHRGSR